MLSYRKIAIQEISIKEKYCAIHWIEIHPVESITHPSNNQGQK